MKFKNFLIVLLLSLFFLGTGSSALESQDMPVIAYDVSVEVAEQVEETEDNRNFLPPILSSSYVNIDSYAITYEPSFFLRDHFTDIQKPPIIS